MRTTAAASKIRRPKKYNKKMSRQTTELPQGPLKEKKTENSSRRLRQRRLIYLYIDIKKYINYMTNSEKIYKIHYT